MPGKIADYARARGETVLLFLSFRGESGRGEVNGEEVSNRWGDLFKLDFLGGGFLTEKVLMED
jgi:hypothetical protein